MSRTNTAVANKPAALTAGLEAAAATRSKRSGAPTVGELLRTRAALKAQGHNPDTIDEELLGTYVVLRRIHPELTLADLDEMPLSALVEVQEGLAVPSL